MNRYLRHIVLEEIGVAGQEKLARAKVLVIGAGGLGCPVLQYLTAAGVGMIGIVDFDRIDESNLQRQVLYGKSNLGMNKAEVAKKKLYDLNHTITIIAYPEKLTQKNATTLFRQYDIIVDATDNLESRFIINDACVITNKPMVYAGVYKFEGQVAVFNYQGSATYRCAFGNNKQDAPSCADIGVLGVLPGIIGSLQANEVLKIILGLGTVLAGKILVYNALQNEFLTIAVSRKEAQFNKVKISYHDIPEEENDNLLTLEQAFKKDNVLFVDVRNHGALPKVKIENSITIPYPILKKKLDLISANKEIIFFCQAGITSKKAAKLFKSLTNKTGYSIQATVFEIQAFLDGKKT